MFDKWFRTKPKDLHRLIGVFKVVERAAGLERVEELLFYNTTLEKIKQYIKEKNIDVLKTGEGDLIYYIY